MSKHSIAVPLTTVSLDHASPVPLYRQLYDWLRVAILTGRLRPGARLQSTRELAEELNVSRNTVMNAFEQLLAEGYLEGQVGSGTYVSRALPDDMLNVPASRSRATAPSRKGLALSERGAALASAAVNASQGSLAVRAFRPGTPALDAFPSELWSRLLARRWRNAPRELLGYSNSAGYQPLREAIASYLGAARAVRCEADQVIVVAGAQQALDLVARLLLGPGDAAWIEDPGYLGTRAAFIGAGARLVPVPVDREGLEVTVGAARAPKARLAYVSPSHQYPLGVTMSLARRLALLEWASRASAWIIEDDYDSEYRYAGRPLAALQGLDKEGRVIYLGTFSKVLFPSLRIGYIVVPPDLVDAFSAARGVLSRFTPSMDQAVLADFINEGHFARHIRRMRTLYAERQAVLVETARRELDGLLEVNPSEAGIHLVGWLAGGADDRKASEAAAGENVEAQALSAFRIKHRTRGGLLLGYAGYDERQIRVGVRRLATALRGMSRAGKSA
ncbi:MAG TPA: PLP-dependent aminotransferase family protein [Blastocatellia bacterium]|nr:PLP-dependent aminotransferase family protein [Blastocatellia bacterium]